MALANQLNRLVGMCHQGMADFVGPLQIWKQQTPK